MIWLLTLVGCLCNPAPTEAPPTPTPEAGVEEMLEELGYLDGADDAPPFTGVRVAQPDKVAPGHNLYCHRAGHPLIVDAAGEVIHEWTVRGAGKLHACRLLPGGKLLVAASSPGREHAADGKPIGFARLLDWDGTILGEHATNVHHDIDATDPDRWLVLDFDLVEPMEFLESELPTRVDAVTTLSPSLERLNSLPVLPLVMHLGVERHGGMSPEHNVYVNVLHLNTVHWVRHGMLKGPYDKPTRMVVTSRTMDEVYVLDPVTKETVWHWGKGMLAAPHGGEILPNGNLLVLDNGKRRKTSIVYEVDPATQKVVWKYEATPPESFFTSGRGAVQRLSNGNTLITSSAQAWAFEVDPEGEMVWEYRCPHMHKADKPHTFRQLERVPIAWMGE